MVNSETDTLTLFLHGFLRVPHAQLVEQNLSSVLQGHPCRFLPVLVMQVLEHLHDSCG